jgi:hypothetical protein
LSSEEPERAHIAEGRALARADRDEALTKDTPEENDR